MTNYEKGIIEKLNQLIDDKYINAESITDNLCHDLGISRSNLYRILKDNFQLSPSLYVRKRKLIKAKELLVNSEMKIGEIAYFIGLDSPQNFTKYFTQAYGVNPTEYRKQVASQGMIKAAEPEHETEEADYKPIIIKRNRFEENLKFIFPGLVVFLLTAFGFYVWQKKYLAKGISEPQKIIAFLPLECKEVAYTIGFNCDSLHKLLINNLSKSKNVILFEATKNMTDLFKEIENYDKSNSVEIAYLLHTKFENIETKPVLSFELFDPKAEKLILSKHYSFNKPITVQQVNEISLAFTSQLSTNILPVGDEKLYLIPTKNLITYKQFLQGSQLFFK
jgi:adenylate cyclase